MPTVPVSPVVSDTDYSKGPRSAYAYNDNWVIVYLNEAQPDEDDEWGRTDRIAIRHLVDHVSDIWVSLYGPDRTSNTGIYGDLQSVLSIVDINNLRITLPNGTSPTTILTTGQLSFDSSNYLSANILTLGAKLTIDATNTSYAYISGSGVATYVPAAFSIALSGIGVSGSEAITLRLPNGSSPYTAAEHRFTKSNVSFYSGATISGGTASFSSVSASTLVAYTAVNIAPSSTQRVDINSNSYVMTDSGSGRILTMNADYFKYAINSVDVFKIDVATKAFYFPIWKAFYSTASSSDYFITFVPPDTVGEGYLGIETASFSPPPATRLRAQLKPGYLYLEQYGTGGSYVSALYPSYMALSGATSTATYSFYRANISYSNVSPTGTVSSLSASSVFIDAPIDNTLRSLITDPVSGYLSVKNRIDGTSTDYKQVIVSSSSLAYIESESGIESTKFSLNVFKGSSDTMLYCSRMIMYTNAASASLTRSFIIFFPQDSSSGTASLITISAIKSISTGEYAYTQYADDYIRMRRFSPSGTEIFWMRRDATYGSTRITMEGFLPVGAGSAPSYIEVGELWYDSSDGNTVKLKTV